MKKCLSVICLFFICASIFAQSTKLSVACPEEGFYNTDGTFVVPQDTTIHFIGNSTSTKTKEWKWLLPGATPSEMEGQAADVVYSEQGTYDIKLQAVVNGKNEELSIPNGVTAGGANFVWNISKEEIAKLDIISLAWYGWYGGTNTLDITKFAEYFHSPMQPACIDSVEVFLGSYNLATTDAILTVSINAADNDGMPGKQLGSTSMLASEIEKSTTLPTIFRFEEPISVNDEFFVTIEGFPNNNGDGIAMKCLRREYNEKCTAYHCLADLDENYQPTGTYTWYKNVDDPTSFAISPWLRYLDVSKIDENAMSISKNIRFDGETLHLPSGTANLDVYTLDGTKMMHLTNPNASISLSSLKRGFYVVRADGKTVKIIRK